MLLLIPVTIACDKHSALFLENIFLSSGLYPCNIQTVRHVYIHFTNGPENTFDMESTRQRNSQQSPQNIIMENIFMNKFPSPVCTEIPHQPYICGIAKFQHPYPPPTAKNIKQHSKQKKLSRDHSNFGASLSV